MLKFNATTGLFKFLNYRVTFNAHGEPKLVYSDDRMYWVNFIAKWYHHDSLNIVMLVPTAEQQARLDEVNAAGTPGERGTFADECAFYVESGAVRPGSTCPFLQDHLNDAGNDAKLAEHYRQSKLRDLANVRYVKEVGGVEVNGQTILTTRESQATVSSTFISMQQGLVETVNWKSANGWVALGLTEMTAIATAVLGHVEKCYSAEKVVTDDLTALTDPEAVKSFDLSAAFETAYSA